MSSDAIDPKKIAAFAAAVDLMAENPPDYDQALAEAFQKGRQGRNQAPAHEDRIRKKQRAGPAAA